MNSTNGSETKQIFRFTLVPYDTRSIMHYHSDYFAIDPDKGSINVKPEFQHAMKLMPNCNKMLATTDIYAINKAYKCNSESIFLNKSSFTFLNTYCSIFKASLFMEFFEPIYAYFGNFKLS